MKKEKSRYVINKVIQALDVLEQFRGEVDELGLSDLSRRLAMREESVRLLLGTLESRNYIEQNMLTKRYRLGFKNLKLAQTVLRQTDLCRVSHPVLAWVAAECRETTAVAVLSKSHTIELEAVLSGHPVQVVSRVGKHLPLHCTAAGKVLIGSETGEMLDRLFEGKNLEGYTSNTVTSVEELKLQLRRIGERGYAIEDEELDSDVCGVAAAIHDYTGRVVGALVITGPSCRFDPDRIAGEFAPLVRKGAREISAKLGFHDAEPERSCIPTLAAEPLVPQVPAKPTSRNAESKMPGVPSLPAEALVRRSAMPRTAIRKPTTADTSRAAVTREVVSLLKFHDMASQQAEQTGASAG